MKLLVKMNLFILLPALIGLFLVSVLGYYYAESLLSRQLKEDIGQIRDLQASELVSIVRLLDSLLQVSTTHPSLVAIADRKEHIGSGVLPPDWPELEKRAERALEVIARKNPSIAYATLLDTHGNVLAQGMDSTLSSSEESRANRASRDYFKEAMQGKIACQATVSNVTGKSVTNMAAPLYDAQNTLIGVLNFVLDNDAITQETLSRIHVGTLGMAYVYSQQGTILMHPDAKQNGRDDSHLPHVPSMLKSSSNEGITSYTTSEGRVKDVLYAQMEHVGWLLVVEADREETMAPVRAMLIRSVLVAVLCALFVGVCIFINVWRISKLLSGISSMVEHLALGELDISVSERNLLERAEKGGDELGVLSTGLLRMTENLRQLFDESFKKTRQAEEAMEAARKATERAEDAAVRAESAKREGMFAAAAQLESAVKVISVAAEELNSHIQLSDASATQAAEELQRAALAMQQMSTTVHEVAGNAEDASQMSAETRQKAEQGAGVVRRSLESISQVRESALELKENMGTLNTHAQSITQIMAVISDIADQTNLLALNAAIEAARAGDAGRGFAVVADEVRKLAEKTMASTQDVGNAIRMIQESTSKSVASMDSAVRQVEQSTEFAQQSGQALEEIVRDAEKTADGVGAIAAASSQQASTAKDINSAISDANERSGQTAEAMTRAAESITRLVEQAKALDALIEEMKRA